MSARRKRNIIISIIAATALIVAALCTLLFPITTPQHIEPDRNIYPVRGIDLSRHNGQVDFEAVADAGIDFVYLKATEGESYLDPTFHNNFSEAKSNGLITGVYHFFRFDCDGERQARNLLAAIDTLGTDLPLAVDVEEWKNPSEIGTALAAERIVNMVQTLRAAGHPVIIYTNKKGYRRFFRPGAPAASCAPLWICSFTDPPMRGEEWILWQHSHIGTVPGVRGKVDLNTFRGDTAAFRRWVQQNQNPVRE